MSATRTPRTRPTITLLTYRQAEPVLGLGRETIRYIVRELGIVPKPTPGVARGKGLDLDDLSRIRRAWERLKEIA